MIAYISPVFNARDKRITKIGFRKSAAPERSDMISRFTLRDTAIAIVGSAEIPTGAACPTKIWLRARANDTLSIIAHWPVSSHVSRIVHLAPSMRTSVPIAWRSLPNLSDRTKPDNITIVATSAGRPAAEPKDQRTKQARRRNHLPARRDERG